jgi:diphosphomevalonate decarboxylase
VKKIETVKQILGSQWQAAPQNSSGEAFAPTNIALCKYWGKRDQELNLPVTASLSISLGNKGASAHLEVTDNARDSIILNGKTLEVHSPFSQRLIHFLDLYRAHLEPKFNITLTSNIPIAAGLASSAAGFASVTKALDQVMGWQLPAEKLSVLARLGSGSAARSLWQGFVEWHAGERADGLDSAGKQLDQTWEELCVGLLILDEKEKPLSSREAMQRTVETSPLYSTWPLKVAEDLANIKSAINIKDFTLLGETAESNAIAMHATMKSAYPPVNYSLPSTTAAMQKIWELRAQGLEIYFTQDAGPNLKLLFLKDKTSDIKKHFPEADILQPFLT